jgi:Flp pilus assembly protein TadD
LTRPGGDRPSLGGNRPGGIGRPGDLTRPNPLPGDRPSLGGNRPVRPTPLPEDITRPLPGRPSFPGAGNRPGDRPGLGNRPGGNYPDRPGIGGNRPGGNYPDRPGSGGNRPYPDRPWGGGGNWGDNDRYPDRPIIGGVNRPSNRPNYRPDRPIIGGGNNNNIINNNVNNNFWNNNTNININNRPGGWGYNPGWSGGWGWNSGWGSHHNWYNGSWNHYSSNWYRPSSTFLFGWGLGSWSTFATTNYYNPYYVATATPVYSYSTPIVIQDVQPVVIQETVRVENAEAPVAAATQTPAPPQPDDAGMKAFNEGMAEFKQGRYAEALVKFDVALAKLPGDPVVHEMRALSYFALGQFQQSAAVLNALLATTPGMDWTTMSGLYGNVDDYTEQLRALESHITSNPDDAAARFVLAYHYLVTGHTDDAIAELEIVVKLQPKDVTAQQILAGLQPARSAPAPTAAAVANSAAAPASTEAAKPAVEGPTTDLVGSWKATNPDVTIELTVTEEFGFTWKATPKDKPPVELKGELSMQGELLVLGTETQGAMSGQVTSEGADQFRFTPPGAPATEQGLTFVRQK